MPTVNKRGMHLLIDDGEWQWPEAVWTEHVRTTARLIGRGGHVVELIRHNDLRPEKWQRFFDAVADEGLVPIVRISTVKNANSQWWDAPPKDADGGYQGEAERFRRLFDAIQWRIPTVVVTVGNEPNRPDEWSGAPNPADYARYLRDMATAFHKVRGVRVVVLNAGLDAYAPSEEAPGGRVIDAERFIEEVHAADPRVFDLLDGWASHSYPIGPFMEHPGRQELKVDDIRLDAPERRPVAGAPPNRGVNGYAWELWKLERLGVRRALPVYITETGWRHAHSQVTPSRDKANGVVQADQFADYLGLAFDGPRTGAASGWTPWNRDSRVVTAALFASAGRPDFWGHTNLFLVGPSGNILGPHRFAERLATVGGGVLDPRFSQPQPR
jgi:hypothetical protein